MQLALQMGEWSYLAAVLLWVDASGAAVSMAEPTGHLDDSIEPQVPAGCPPFVKDVPCIGVKKSRCDVLFLRVGDGGFAEQEAFAWEALGEPASWFLAMAFSRTKKLWPAGRELLAASERLGFVAETEEGWFSATDGPLARACTEIRQGEVEVNAARRRRGRRQLPAGSARGQPAAAHRGLGPPAARWERRAHLAWECRQGARRREHAPRAGSHIHPHGHGKGQHIGVPSGPAGRRPPVPEIPRGPASSRETERAEEVDEEAEGAEESWGPQANNPVGALMQAAAKLNERRWPGADARHKTKNRKTHIVGLDQMQADSGSSG